MVYEQNQQGLGTTDRKCDLYFNVVMLSDDEPTTPSDGKAVEEINKNLLKPIILDSNRSLESCEGINLVCQQVLSLLSSFSGVFEGDKVDGSGDGSGGEGGDMGMFVSLDLTDKLLRQLEDPLVVVSGALPDWVKVVPAICSSVFSLRARRILLERGGFGVSRAVFRQQETKVNVSDLRRRINAINARANALMEEAFSPDMSDPAAIQIQANELYNLEEQLRAQVATAFKRQRWAEHWLQSAKGVVSRENILSDGKQFMESYANNARANRRRLEIQFKGESGFDAAAGEQAGVTRGFYSDVARAFSEIGAAGVDLWIADVDSEGGQKEIIPTPRAEGDSEPGLFPRPIGRGNKDYKEVCDLFKFMGRVFAAAMRDGFLVPLHLSCAFWRVLRGGEGEELRDGDLPRPSFLGGGVYALTKFMSKIEKIDVNRDITRREKMKRREELENDPGFGREYLGQNYDLSFLDYIENKTFIDPLSAGEEGCHELKPGGREIAVTSENCAEYCSLCKKFILSDGIVGQARAFRSGFNDFIPAHFALNLFSPREIRLELSGNSEVSNWTEEDIRNLFSLVVEGGGESIMAVNAIGGAGGNSLSRRFNDDSLTFRFLVRGLLEASELCRRQFLDFVTSIPVCTSKKIELVPIVSSGGEFLPVSDLNMPRANTCARRLYMPKFSDYFEFKDIFWKVVVNESQFKGFHEWTS